jgi:large subunit ribosomal protein L25
MAEIHVETRPKTSTAEVSRLRKNGILPMALIERGQGTRLIQGSAKHIKDMLQAKDGLKIFGLDLDTERKMRVVVKQIDRDISTRRVINIVFLEVRDEDKIKMSIPLEFSGVPAAVEKGAASLITPIATLECQGQVKILPDSIKVDLSEMKQNDRIILQDITLPEGLHALNSVETVIATTVQLRGMLNLEESAEAPAEEAPAEAASEEEATEE